jgi:hypothetical protein
MKALSMGVSQIILEQADVVLCGGMESMSTIPYLLKGARFGGFKMGDRKLEDGWGDSYDPIAKVSMGMTAENVGEKYGISREDMRLRYDEIVAFADIGEFVDQPVKSYSSGMMMRLAFAVAVHVDPDILVIDEAGNVAGFNAKNSEHLITADSQYGAFDETLYSQKLKEEIYEGGFSIKTTAVARKTARRFVKRKSYGNQIFLIKKRRAINPELLDKGLDLVTEDVVKHDQIVGLQWRNGEIRETWKSPKFPRDIVDFAFTKENGKEIMVVLTRNKDNKYALELLH